MPEAVCGACVDAPTPGMVKNPRPTPICGACVLVPLPVEAPAPALKNSTSIRLAYRLTKLVLLPWNKSRSNIHCVTIPAAMIDAIAA